MILLIPGLAGPKIFVGSENKEWLFKKVTGIIGAPVFCAILNAPGLNDAIFGLSLSGIPPSGKIANDQPFLIAFIAEMRALADRLLSPLYIGIFSFLK